MKNKIISVLALLLLSNALFAKDNGLVGSVALVGMDMDYKEYKASDGTLLDSEESSFTNIGGAEMNVGYIFGSNSFSYNQAGAKLMIVGGETTYKGSLLHSSNPYGSVVSKTQNTIVDFAISYKRGNMLSNRLELNYGIGLGYRSWERALSASQIETYTWYSLRPMMGLKFLVNSKVDVGLSIEYQLGINPTMHSSNPNLDFTLGRADITEISLPVSYTFNEKMSMFFEYTYQIQTIDKSNVIYSGGYWYYEPESTANNQYLKLGLAFKF